MSINASDKQMGVGFGTNDVFSSQHDEDDGSMANQQLDRFNANTIEQQQDPVAIDMQTRIITYQLPKDFNG